MDTEVVVEAMAVVDTICMGRPCEDEAGMVLRAEEAMDRVVVAEELDSPPLHGVGMVVG